MMTINFYTTPCQLKHIPDNRVVVKFPSGLNGAAEFTKDYEHIEKAMKDGIQILDYQKEDYPEFKTNVVKLEDKNFGKAFYEIYFKNNLGSKMFAWVVLNGEK